MTKHQRRKQRKKRQLRNKCRRYANQGSSSSTTDSSSKQCAEQPPRRDLCQLPHADVATPKEFAELFMRAYGKSAPCIFCSQTVASLSIFNPHGPAGAVPGRQRCTVYWMCESCANSDNRDEVERILDMLPWYAGVIGASKESA